MKSFPLAVTVTTMGSKARTKAHDPKFQLPGVPRTSCGVVCSIS